MDYCTPLCFILTAGNFRHKCHSRHKCHFWTDGKYHAIPTIWSAGVRSSFPCPRYSIPVHPAAHSFPLLPIVALSRHDYHYVNLHLLWKSSTLKEKHNLVCSTKLKSKASRSVWWFFSATTKVNQRILWYFLQKNDLALEFHGISEGNGGRRGEKNKVGLRKS